jgi:ABC-type branched-subunit amino acid transport system ATPase component
MTEFALEARDLRKSFGAFLATSDVTLKVRQGARHALIGPNGAGKTTLVNLLTGFLRADAGTVLLNGQDITGLNQHRRARRGLSRTFQINRLFANMTVEESLALAIAERKGLGWQFWKPLSRYGEVLDEAGDWLQRLRLSDMARVTTRDLAYGKQRILELALALATRPRILLLDEPAAGIPTRESRELFEILAQLPEETTVLLIEHDMDLVFRFADRISVLVNGALIVEDTPDRVARHPLVKEVYLGTAQNV